MKDSPGIAWIIHREKPPLSCRTMMLLQKNKRIGKTCRLAEIQAYCVGYLSGSASKTCRKTCRNSCRTLAGTVVTDTTKRSSEGIKSQETPSRSAWSLGNENLHAECAYPQLLHDGAVVLAAGTDEENFLANLPAFHTGTAFVEQHLVVLVDGDEDVLVVFFMNK